MNGLESYFSQWGPSFGGGLLAGFGAMMIIIVIWSIFWKGMALWKAAREGSKVWFVVLLIVNTIGILEILYIYVFSKNKSTSGTSTTQS